MNALLATAGTRVTYVPEFGMPERGIVKSQHPSREAAWVVYKCGGDWPNYQNYTGNLTNLEDLKEGWL